MTLFFLVFTARHLGRNVLNIGCSCRSSRGSGGSRNGLILLVEDNGGHYVANILLQDWHKVRGDGGRNSLASDGLVLLGEGEVTKLMQLLTRWLERKYFSTDGLTS